MESMHLWKSMQLKRLTNCAPRRADEVCLSHSACGSLARVQVTADVMENDDACALWDRLMEAGSTRGILPAGLDALDMTRVEAGFVMNGVDYYSANHCAIDLRKSTPYETGLGWTVQLKRTPFIGQGALRAE